MSARRARSIAARRSVERASSSAAIDAEIARLIAAQNEQLARIESANVVHVRECVVQYVDANAVQAHKRHRARHRDAAKRHTEQSQYARARFEQHDVTCEMFNVTRTLRATNAASRVDHVADANERARARSISRRDDMQRRRKTDAAHAHKIVECTCSAHAE